MLYKTKSQKNCDFGTGVQPQEEETHGLKKKEEREKKMKVKGAFNNLGNCRERQKWGGEPQLVCVYLKSM